MFRRRVSLNETRQDPSGLAPDPTTTPEAVIQFYAARAFSWRPFAVHTWVAFKPSKAPRWSRYEVLGFGVRYGRPAVRIDRHGPDNWWFGARPRLLLDKRGPECDALIEKILTAIARYPWPNRYSHWPGPNSNTFTAYLARRVPELGLALPAHAIGKDFLPRGPFLARAPSGTGFQISFWGLIGVLLALAEGFEINLLGLVFGVGFRDLSLKLPFLGDLRLSRRRCDHMPRTPGVQLPGPA
jgi:Protein of unknown function (DUF3750)